MRNFFKKKVNIPYARQSISEDDISEVVKVLRSDFLTQGKQVGNFAKLLSKKINSKYTILTNSATSALHIAYLSLGLGKGDVLWTSPNTFVATANAAIHCGASVDFVDIDPQTLNISIDDLKNKLEKANKNNCLPKVITCVHFAGQSCFMKDIFELSKIYNFSIVEDASHSIGASYRKNKVGSCKYSDITVFSFHPVKIITTGEGGAATTNNPSIANKMKLLSSHGIEKGNAKINNERIHEIWNYEQINNGFNYRMTEFQAALGISQLKKLNKFVKKRNQIANKYNQKLKNLPIKLPFVHKDNISSFHLYPIRIPISDYKKNQEYFYNELRKRKILVNIHYIPVYRQPYYKKLGFRKGYCPEAELYFNEAITLPIFPGLKEYEQDFIIKNIISLNNE